MAGSIMVAVRKAIIAGLADLPGLADVDVSYQWGRLDEQPRERIYTNRAVFNHSPAALRAGRNYRNESGSFDLVVVVAGIGLEAEETGERALELGALAEEWIADRKSDQLGVPGLITLQVAGQGALNEMFNDSGTLAEVTYPVAYTARLT